MENGGLFEQEPAPKEVARLIAEDVEYIIMEGVTVIGKETKASMININNPQISPFHAQIIVIGNQHYIVDLHSTHGTTLRNRPLTPLRCYPLHNGAIFTLGGVSCHYKYMDKVSDVPFTYPSGLGLASLNLRPNVLYGNSPLMDLYGRPLQQAFLSAAAGPLFQIPQITVPPHGFHVSPPQTSDLDKKSNQEEESDEEHIPETQQDDSLQSIDSSRVVINESSILDDTSSDGEITDSQMASLDLRCSSTPAAPVASQQTGIPSKSTRTANAAPIPFTAPTPFRAPESQLDLRTAFKHPKTLDKQSIHEASTQLDIDDDFLTPKRAPVVTGQSIHEAETQLDFDPDNDSDIHEASTQFIINDTIDLSNADTSQRSLKDTPSSVRDISVCDMETQFINDQSVNSNEDLDTASVHSAQTICNVNYDLDGIVVDDDDEPNDDGKNLDFAETQFDDDFNNMPKLVKNERKIKIEQTNILGFCSEKPICVDDDDSLPETQFDVDSNKFPMSYLPLSSHDSTRRFNTSNLNSSMSSKEKVKITIISSDESDDGEPKKYEPNVKKEQQKIPRKHTPSIITVSDSDDDIETSLHPSCSTSISTEKSGVVPQPIKSELESNDSNITEKSTDSQYRNSDVMSNVRESDQTSIRLQTSLEDSVTKKPQNNLAGSSIASDGTDKSVNQIKSPEMVVDSNLESKQNMNHQSPKLISSNRPSDIYVETPSVVASGKTTMDENEDIFDQPTQNILNESVVDMTLNKPPEQPITNADEVVSPCQSPPSLYENDDYSIEDVFVMPTQKISVNYPLPSKPQKKINQSVKCDEEIYDILTQKCSTSTPNKNQNAFNIPQQPVSKENVDSREDIYEIATQDIAPAGIMAAPKDSIIVNVPLHSDSVFSIDSQSSTRLVICESDNNEHNRPLGETPVCSKPIHGTKNLLDDTNKIKDGVANSNVGVSEQSEHIFSMDTQIADTVNPNCPLSSERLVVCKSENNLILELNVGGSIKSSSTLDTKSISANATDTRTFQAMEQFEDDEDIFDMPTQKVSRSEDDTFYEHTRDEVKPSDSSAETESRKLDPSNPIPGSSKTCTGASSDATSSKTAENTPECGNHESYFQFTTTRGGIRMVTTQISHTEIVVHRNNLSSEVVSDVAPEPCKSSTQEKASVDSNDATKAKKRKSPRSDIKNSKSHSKINELDKPGSEQNNNTCGKTKTKTKRSEVSGERIAEDEVSLKQITRQKKSVVSPLEETLPMEKGPENDGGRNRRNKSKRDMSNELRNSTGVVSNNGSISSQNHEDCQHGGNETIVKTRQPNQNTKNIQQPITSGTVNIEKHERGKSVNVRRGKVSNATLEKHQTAPPHKHTYSNDSKEGENVTSEIQTIQSNKNNSDNQVGQKTNKHVKKTNRSKSRAVANDSNSETGDGSEFNDSSLSDCPLSLRISNSNRRKRSNNDIRHEVPVADSRSGNETSAKVKPNKSTRSSQRQITSTAVNRIEDEIDNYGNGECGKSSDVTSEVQKTQSNKSNSAKYAKKANRSKSPAVAIELNSKISDEGALNDISISDCPISLRILNSNRRKKSNNREVVPVSDDRVGKETIEKVRSIQNTRNSQRQITPTTINITGDEIGKSTNVSGSKTPDKQMTTRRLKNNSSNDSKEDEKSAFANVRRGKVSDASPGIQKTPSIKNNSSIEDKQKTAKYVKKANRSKSPAVANLNAKISDEGEVNISVSDGPISLRISNNKRREKSINDLKGNNPRDIVDLEKNSPTERITQEGINTDLIPQANKSSALRTSGRKRPGETSNEEPVKKRDRTSPPDSSEASTSCSTEVMNLPRSRGRSRRQSVQMSDTISKTEEVAVGNKPKQVSSTSSVSSLETEGTASSKQDVSGRKRGSKSTPQTKESTPSKRKKGASGLMQLNSSVVDSPRRTRLCKYKVMFTLCQNKSNESLVLKLGGTIVEEVNEMDVLVTNKIARTVKLLGAISLGKPVVSPKWLQASQKASHFVDPWDYLLVDAEAHEKFNFDIVTSLELAKKHGLLFQGYTIFMSKSVLDGIKVMLANAGAKCVSRYSVKDSKSERFFIVSCPEDIPNLKLKSGETSPMVVASEAVIASLIQQRIDLESHVIH